MHLLLWPQSCRDHTGEASEEFPCPAKDGVGCAYSRTS
jgi:hypothetical protein